MNTLALRQNARYATLDVWRGVACLMVVAFHSTYYARVDGPGEGLAGWLVGATARGWIGVPIFFVISGYCISAAGDSVRRSSQTLGDFFYRRFKRILPPYWVTLGATLLLVLWVEAAFPGFFTDDPNGIAAPGTLGGWQWLGNATLTEGWRSHLTPGASQFLLGHAWALGYEEQFYAVTGVLLVLPARWFFPATAGVTALTLGLFVWQRMGAALPVDGLFLDGRWLLFAAGVGVYYRANHAGPTARWLVLAALAGGVAYAGHAPWKLTLIKANFWQELFIACAFALAIALLRRWDARLTGWPILSPLRAAGKRCFSLYLVHLPVVKGISHLIELAGLKSDVEVLLVTLPLSIAGTLAVGWFFHRYVERRFLNPPADASPAAAQLAAAAQPQSSG